MSEFLALNYTKYLERNQLPPNMSHLKRILERFSLEKLQNNPEASEVRILKSLLLPSKSSFEETIFNLGNAISLLKSKFMAGLVLFILKEFFI